MVADFNVMAVPFMVASGGYYFRMTPGKQDHPRQRDFSGWGAAFKVGDTGQPDELMWATNDWWSADVALSCGGSMLARLEAVVRKDELREDPEVLFFYRDGQLFKSFRLSFFIDITDPYGNLGWDRDLGEMLTRDGYVPWSSDLYLVPVMNGQETVVVARYDGGTYRFDLNTGEHLVTLAGEPSTSAPAESVDSHTPHAGPGTALTLIVGLACFALGIALRTKWKRRRSP